MISPNELARNRQTEQDRIRLFVERNHFRDQVEILEIQLIKQRTRSFVVIFTLLTIIALMFGGYILCLELIYDPSMMTSLINPCGRH